MDTPGFNLELHKDKSTGEKANSVFQSIDFLKKSISIHHGTLIILTNGFTEEVFLSYKSVEVSGRPLHRLTCLVPHFSNGFDGFEYVVPLLVKEDADRSNPQGLLLSKGFIPRAFRDAANRYRIEDTSNQKFIGFVSKLPELSSHSIMEGNSTNEEKRDFTHADTQDFVNASGFINKKQAGVAVVEQLHEMGILDERRSERRALDSCATQNYPYAKTESGALQLPKMPW